MIRSQPFQGMKKFRLSRLRTRHASITQISTQRSSPSSRCSCGFHSSTPNFPSISHPGRASCRYRGRLGSVLQRNWHSPLCQCQPIARRPRSHNSWLKASPCSSSSTVTILLYSCSIYMNCYTWFQTLLSKLSNFGFFLGSNNVQT
jgi:hypothetical protein